jgi:hypothetical protein
MVAVTTTDGLMRAIGAASSIDLAAYQLRSGSALVAALEGAVRDHHADVHVSVDGNPFHDSGGAIARATGAAARELRRFGVKVNEVTDHSVHIKAAVIDGRAFLDDRNFTSGGHDTILETDQADDVALVRDAIDRGRTGTDGRLATHKAAAQTLEVDVVAHGSGDCVDMESESFGYSGDLYHALSERAKHGDHVRLIVSDGELRDADSGAERKALAKLALAGVDVRVGASRSGVGNEKLCVAGDRAWAGSANATWPKGDPMDWGLETSDRTVVDALRARFEANWSASKPYAAA